MPPGTFTPIEDMVGGGPFDLDPGQWTDDTSMALCLAESIVDRDANDLADQLRRYVAWWKRGYLSSNGKCFDIGTTIRPQLARFLATGEPVDSEPDEERAANGSMMRLAPVPIRWHNDLEEAAEQAATSSRSTHAAQRPVDACRVLGAMIAALIRGDEAEGVFADEFWQWGPLHPAIDAVARGSWRSKQPPAIRGSGYCVDALEAALWAVQGADDFRSAVLRAANLGDDADTTAAIAGQLAGARWGASAIPERWRTRITMADRIASLADNLCAQGAAEGGDHRWRFDSLVHAWWVEPGRLLAGEYPGHRDPHQAAMKLAVLVDAGIRTFVDLTTPEDTLLPYSASLDEIALQRGIELTHVAFPIADLSVGEDGYYDEIVRRIGEEIKSNRPVFVHCWGGVGRTATVVGCWLVDGGFAGEAALDRVRELREGTGKSDRVAPETRAQRELIRRRGPRAPRTSSA
ncbi:MAG TPA: ADP-ribosylglycohydrolase family protein, partial [Acidimicrobiales bacterium]|nr:ADP-ribosylglycohydrolase family protein [Acidimicrobiales bacterium]